MEHAMRGACEKTGGQRTFMNVANKRVIRSIDRLEIIQTKERFKMKRKVVVLISVMAMALIAIGVASADPGKPSFIPMLYADGEVWGTKGAAALPAPNANNLQSFDKLFVIVNGVSGQMPVAEAAPGNPNYNGGRWYTHTVEWTEDAVNAGAVVLLTSYADVHAQFLDGNLTITAGSPGPPPPDFFECPLLPVK